MTMALGVMEGEGTGFQAETQAPSVCDSEAGSKEEPRDPDGGIHYAELSQQESGDHRDKVKLGEEAAWVVPSPSMPGCVPSIPLVCWLLPPDFHNPFQTT